MIMAGKLTTSGSDNRIIIGVIYQEGFPKVTSSLAAFSSLLYPLRTWGGFLKTLNYLKLSNSIFQRRFWPTRFGFAFALLSCASPGHYQSAILRMLACLLLTMLGDRWWLKPSERILITQHYSPNCELNSFEFASDGRSKGGYNQ